ncbi:MAG: spermidine/putrescine ABC transporter substrate-binding protein [Bacteroidia bacterium]|nr:spermidine/putrescine ABC transporter substrate-binding protein [Bacteroidia bacterium]
MNPGLLPAGWRCLTMLLLLAGLAACRPREDRLIRADGVEVMQSELGDALHLFIYPDYIDSALVRQFSEQYGVEVIFDYYDNSEALVAKLLAGGKGQYDVIVPADYAVAILIKLDMLEPLDSSHIPNLRNLDARFRSLPFDPGNRYTACYQWGTTGLGARTDLIGAPYRGDSLNTWRMLFDPAWYPGQFALLDDPREAIGAALRFLGHSVNTADPGLIAQATDLLISQKHRIVAYNTASTGRDFLLSGDAPLILNHSGDVFMAADPQVTYRITQEGGIMWADNLAIPRSAPHKRAAEAFINFILGAEQGAALAAYTLYATPNRAARKLLPDSIREHPFIYPADSVLDRMEFLQDLGPATRIYSQAWTRFKAAQ